MSDMSDDPADLGLHPPSDKAPADATRALLHKCMVTIENAPPWAMAEIHSELRRLERVAEYMAANVSANA